jgi:AraC-like DNA-binding protein
MEVIQTDLRVAKAVQLLNEDPSRTLADLACGCALSISRLSHLFRAEAGLTLKEFRRKRRLEVAMKMLATTDMPIKQIAYALGYRHTSSFVRAFEVNAGMSPSDYRRSEVRDHDAEVPSIKSLINGAHVQLDQVRDAQSHRSVSVSVGSRESQELD